MVGKGFPEAAWLLVVLPEPFLDADDEAPPAPCEPFSICSGIATLEASNPINLVSLRAFAKV
jgi:hypothetical protein